MKDNFVINLGRQLGSGGREIGEKLAKELNIAFYDKELINLASKESGLCREFFEQADEKASKTILGGLFGSRFPFLTEGAYPYNSYLSNDSLFKIQSDVIRELAEKQSCLFVGRCADYILRDHPRCAHQLSARHEGTAIYLELSPKAAQEVPPASARRWCAVGAAWGRALPGSGQNKHLGITPCTAYNSARNGNNPAAASPLKAALGCDVH